MTLVTILLSLMSVAAKTVCVASVQSFRYFTTKSDQPTLYTCKHTHIRRYEVVAPFALSTGYQKRTTTTRTKMYKENL